MKKKKVVLAVWKGSEKTKNIVYDEILKRWGEAAAEKYDPLKNCFTYKTWLAKGYQVKKGEKAIRSITLIEKKDPNAKVGENTLVRTYPKSVFLFYKIQVEKKKK